MKMIVSAIVLEVNSYGGYPVAGEEVALALKRATNPTMSYLGYSEQNKRDGVNYVSLSYGKWQRIGDFQ